MSHRDSGSAPDKGVRYGLQAVLDRAFASIALWSTRHVWLIAGLSLLLLLAGLFGAAQVRQDNSMEAYFNEEDPSYAHYKEYVEEFSSDEVVYLLYRAPERAHGPFDLEVMQRIEQLTRALETEVPFVRKVTSLSNVEFIRADGDFIEIRPLMDPFPATQDELLELRALALSKPIYVGAIVNADASYAAIAVEMSRTSTDPIERLRFDPDGGDGIANLYPQVPNTKVREILARPEYQGIEFLISGDVPMNAAYNEVLGYEIGLLSVATLVLIALLSVWMFRARWLGLLAPLAVVVLSLVLTLGLMGLVGWRINLFFLMIPTLLCAVGVAQCVHVLYAWQQARQTAPDAAEAVRAAIAKVGTPCLLAAATTSVGFLGMAVSNLRAIHELAFYSAFGVMCTFLLSISLLVGLAMRSKPVPARATAAPTAASDGVSRLIEALVAVNLKHARAILIVFLLIALAAAAGLSRLRIDFNFLHEFKPSAEWRQHTERINEVMGGLLSVVYVFDTDTPDGIKNAALLSEIERLQALADSHEVAQDSLSIVDIVKELNQAFHGGDPAYYRLPEDSDMLAQLLLVYELSGGKEMNDVLNLDRSKTALQIRLKLVGAAEVRRFLDSMDTHLATHPVSVGRVEISGIGLLWVHMADYIADTQITGYAVVFGLIALMMIVAFGSVGVGMLGMIPNLFPILLALGAMGWLGWDLDYFRLLLATIAIGIAVDDTVHMLARLRSEFAASGRYRDAVAGALRGVGPAIIATTAILTVAFMSYLISSMAVLTSFGVLLAGAMVTALLADLFLLPALVLWLRPFGAERASEPIAAEAGASS